MRPLYVLMLILICSFTTGCAKTHVSPPHQPLAEKTDRSPLKKQPPKASVLKPGDYFPLMKGASWEYQGEGNEYASFSRKVLFTKENLAQISEDNGGTVSTSIFQTTPQSVTRVFFAGETYSVQNYLDSPPNEANVLLQAPIKVGTKWQTSLGTREIVDLHARVDTPSGTFSDCLKIKIPAADSTTFEYYKRAVGLVKREFISGEAKVTSALKKFSGVKQAK